MLILHTLHVITYPFFTSKHAEVTGDGRFGAICIAMRIHLKQKMIVDLGLCFSLFCSLPIRWPIVRLTVKKYHKENLPYQNKWVVKWSSIVSTRRGLLM